MLRGRRAGEASLGARAHAGVAPPGSGTVFLAAVAVHRASTQRPIQSAGGALGGDVHGENDLAPVCLEIHQVSIQIRVRQLVEACR